MPVTKPVGSTATFTAVVRNAEGVLLPDAVVTFTDDVTDPVVPVAGTQTATLVGTALETATVTATVQGAAGPITATDTATFVDNTPASVAVTAS